MYNKSNKNSRVINILVGVIAVLIIIFLIVFLVNKTNSNKTVNNDQQFADNLDLLHQTAKQFFAGQLPDEVGGTLQTTLSELIDMGAIEELKYGNETCDIEESYVSITKTSKDEYRVKSNLVCADKSDSTIEKIKSSTTVTDKDGNTIVDETDDKVDLDVEKNPSSNNSSNTTNGNGDSTVYCKDFNCTVEEIPTTCTVSYEYEFVKRSVNCPNGYNISGSVCVMESTNSVAPTPHYSDPTTVVENAKVNKGEPYKVYTDPIRDVTDGHYYCTEGTLVGDKCVLYKDKVVTYVIECPYGYNPVGFYCYKYADRVGGTTESYCPDGYTDNGTNCYKKVPGTKTTVTEPCPNGYTQSGDYCYKYADKIVSTKVTCPSGTQPSGDKCIKTVSAVKTYTPWGNPVKTYQTSKPEAEYVHELEKKVKVGEGTVFGSTVYTYSIYRRTSYYTCSQGKLSGDKCLVESPGNVTTTKKCPDGYTDNGTNCYIRQKVTTTTKTTCSAGYTPIGDYCYTYTNKLTRTTNGTCPSGYTDSGSTCYIKTNGTTKEIKSCPSGYSDNGTNCKTYKDAKYTGGYVYYKCPSDYTSSGSGSTMTCYKYVQSDDEYYCENAAAELKGTLCYIKKDSEFQYNSCEDGYVLGGDNMCHSTSVSTVNPTWTDVDYIFSSQTYIPGYQRTGRGKYHQVCVKKEESKEPSIWK